MVGYKLKRGQMTVYLITFLCMVAAHSSREGWWMVKADVHEEMGFTSTQLGLMDSTFLFLYALGYFTSGVIADCFSPTKVLRSGMSLGMLCFWIMGVLGLSKVTSYWIYTVLWGIEGPAQGCVLTITVGIMANWFPSSERGKLMGFWGANASVGNIVGEWVAAILHHDLGLGWEWVIIVTGSLLGIMAYAVYAFVKDSPEEEDQHMPLLDNAVEEVERAGFWKAWKLPGVASCAICYGGVKLLNYGFFMWLPYYLRLYYGMDMIEIGLLTSLYDLGGVVGSVLGGYFSDLVKVRSATVELMLVLAVPMLLVFQTVQLGNEWMFYLVVPTTGFMVGGSANIIAAAVSADLSEKEGAKYNARTTVIGIINGTGSLGAAIGQIIIGWLQTISWNAVFYFMVLVCVGSLMSLLPLAIKDSKQKIANNKYKF